jgi:hypothetical protein
MRVGDLSNAVICPRTTSGDRIQANWEDYYVLLNGLSEDFKLSVLNILRNMERT